MTDMGIWYVLWFMEIAFTSGAPKPHQQVLEVTKRQNDSVQMEIHNQENILSQVRYFVAMNSNLLFVCAKISHLKSKSSKYEINVIEVNKTNHVLHFNILL